MRIALIKGRDFDARDATNAPGVVIFNEEAASSTGRTKIRSASASNSAIRSPARRG
jgi:hypothetical protein